MCLIDVRLIQLHLIRTPIALNMIFTAITGLFPSCVHAVMQSLTLHIMQLALMMNPVPTIALHVILVPGITLLSDTVTLME